MSAVALWLFLAAAQFAQSATGELRLDVTDSGGLGLQSRVTLSSTVNQFAQALETGVDGTLVVRRVPFGRYRLTVSRDGFAPSTTLLDVESALPLNYRVALTIAPVQAEVTVNPGETLLDLRQTGSTNRVGRESLQRRLTALPGRALSDVVNTQPGWLLEANGILHPRGSEYQVQYVIDGLPITDNRSPTFAPEFDADDVHAMSIVTGGYPAEYGRKLGGVIEVVTAGQAREGVHGAAGTSFGSFGTATGFASTQFGWKHTTLGISGNLARTDRYLDPPVEQGWGSSSPRVSSRRTEAASGWRAASARARRSISLFRSPNQRYRRFPPGGTRPAHVLRDGRSSPIHCTASSMCHQPGERHSGTTASAHSFGCLSD